MLRLLHTADVHLGARHTDLGERAAVLRERQFAAFRATVDLAIVETVDLFLIAGDLFDSNTQPRRSVERVAAELGRLANASHSDGDHPRHARRLRRMRRSTAPTTWRHGRYHHEWIAVLTPHLSEHRLPSLDAVVTAASSTPSAPPRARSKASTPAWTAAPPGA